MRGILIGTCVVILAVSGWGWWQYWLAVVYPQPYHRVYFAMVAVPALGLCLALILLTCRWIALRIVGALLCVPALPAWLLALALVFNDFRAH